MPSFAPYRRAGSLLLLISVLPLRPLAAEPAKSPAREETVTLSPFVVREDDAVGYSAIFTIFTITTIFTILEIGN